MTVEGADRKPVILLVDDSKFSLSQAQKALQGEFEVLTSNGGAEALAKLDNTKVDLVITDLLMPQVTGLALIGVLRSRHPSVKIIVCSADVQDATSERALSLGAAAFLNKPIEAADAVRVVRLVLSQQKKPRELTVTPRYADAFQEIFNIGMGRAAKALSKLVYETVKLSVPKLEILEPHHLAGYIADQFQDEIACVRQGFAGTTDGTAFLLLSANSGRSLVDALVKDRKEPPEGLDLGDLERGLLTEVGNILINSLVGTLANTLGIEFRFEQADCTVGDARSVYGDLKLRDSDYVLYLETLFVVPGRNIGGSLVILLGSGGMKTVFEGIDRVF